jgi:hypothetical protein
MSLIMAVGGKPERRLSRTWTPPLWARSEPLKALSLPSRAECVECTRQRLHLSHLIRL